MEKKLSKLQLAEIRRKELGIPTRLERAQAPQSLEQKEAKYFSYLHAKALKKVKKAEIKWNVKLFTRRQVAELMANFCMSQTEPNEDDESIGPGNN